MPTQVSAPSRGRSVATLGVLACVIFVTISFEMLPIGLLGPIAEGFDASSQGAGLLVSAYAVTVVLLAIPLAAFTARFDARRLLAFTLMAFAATAITIVVAPTLPIAIVARFAAGAAHAIIFTVVFRLALETVPEQRRGVAAGTVSSANALALSVGVPAATALGVSLRWQAPFLVIVATFIALAVLTMLVLPQSGRETEAVNARDVLRAVRQPALLKVGVTTVTVMTAQFLSYTYVEPLLRERGVNADQVSLVLLGYGFAGVVGLILVLRVSARWPSGAFRVATVLVGASILGLALSEKSTIATVCFVLAWGATFGALPLLVQVLALRGAASLPSAAAPINNASFNIGIAAGSAAGGTLLATTNSTLLLTVSIALFLGMLLATFLPKWLPSDVPPGPPQPGDANVPRGEDAPSTLTTP